MFTKKTYVLVCHGCGKFHEQVSEFISAPQSILLTPHPDVEFGTRWTIPTLACPECSELNKVDGRIRHAYLHGMTRDAMDRANREFQTYWHAELVRRKKLERY